MNIGNIVNLERERSFSFLCKNYGGVSMKWDKVVSGTIAVCGSLANYLWGGWDMTFRLLVTFMVLDYILGVICGFKEKELSSEIAFKGILKKVTILIVVAVGVSIDNTLNAQGIARNMVIFFYAGLEGISIVENAGRMGVPIPDRLKDALVQLKEGNKKEVRE